MLETDVMRLLQFIFGPAGTGKSTEIRNKIKALLESGEDKLTLIVPEQFSFTCHKDMLALAGARVFRTDESGAVTVRMHEDGSLSIRTYR